MDKNSLGCGKEFKKKTVSGFICGVPDAWGHEKLCEACDAKLRKEWAMGNTERMKKILENN
ncbi:MAG TPA: hypothetical protein ENI02_03005 [Candidatus Aminicenantes bacterium]|nr:hypothetical protein [Candidatus Aminicenantes bacterium]